MINREVFARDPLQTTIPNDGVAKLGEPSTYQEWEVLRYELENFVCEGEYERGLDKILSTYLSSLDKTTQPAAWVSGFYGSGKSHLVRVLEFLWRDAEFPGGATARGLVNLPERIREHLRELDTAGRRGGGLWSAAGTLDAGAGDSVRLAILGILLRSARLPGRYAQGRFVLRLMQDGVYEAVKKGVEAEGRDLQTELANLYVSHHLRRSLLSAHQEFAADDAEARALIRDQYPDRQDISEEEMLETMGEVLSLTSGDRDNPPCTLLVLDELQQYIGDNPNRTLQVQTAVESCSSRFGSRILFVATGQAALTATTQLSKLQGRYTVRVPLSDTDVEEVVRQVVLRKAPGSVFELRQVLEENSGEIDRQLGSTNIGPSRSDDTVLVPDYPLLPTRRRFWERVLRATDRAGSSSQLRAQLRIVLTATQEVAEEPVGTVIPADLLYEHIRPDMLQTGVLLREVDDTIREQRIDGTEEGELRSRLCALIFLIGQLPTEPGADTGVRATADTLADLLIHDLIAGSAPLRARIPELLEGLVERGTLMQVEGEYRLQTRESAEWTAAYQNAEARIRGDDARIAGDRSRELRQAVNEVLRNIRLPQGASKTPRQIELHFTSDAPPTDTGAVPVWVRDEWSVGDKTVRDEARAAGPEDPTVNVFLPKQGAEDLKRAVAGYEAASEVLQGRPVPNTREGQEARAAMETRQRTSRASLDAMFRSVLEGARVLQGGGSEVVEDSLRAAVESAAWASLERLYPQFGVADNAKWDTVIKRARQGSGDPLEPLGHEGDTDKHPACSKVLAFVGASGKRGREVREHFKAPPHGWPQDAVDGSLLALLSVGVLRASINAAPVTAKEVDQGKIGVTDFRSETVIFSRVQLIGVRKLFAEAGMQVHSGEELAAAHNFLGAARDLATSAGGEAPLPAPPDAGFVRDIRDLGGNELLVSLYENRDRLREEMASWRAAKQEIEVRTPRWQRLRRLLDHARPLSAAEPLRHQADAIHRERSLLQEPDPAPPLLNSVTDLLREAITDAHRRYTETFDAGLRPLESSGSWQTLDEKERDGLLRKHGLHKRSAPRLGDEAAVLDTLDATPLGEWESSIDALPERFARANVEATKKLEPEAHRFRPPSATLKTREEVDDYIERVKVEILGHIEEGRPVVL